MPIDNSDTTQSADAALAHHRALVAALEGERPMDWTAWALPIHDAQNLTPRGREAVLWAADVLQRAFGDNFLNDAWRHHRTRPPVQLWEHPKVHPVFDQGVWPLANFAPWAIANLLQFAAQLELVRTISRPVRISMKDYRDPVKWVHGVLQLELAGLGLRGGWQPTFEPPLGTGRNADVRLDGQSAAYSLVEVRSLRMWQREARAMEAASQLSGRLMFGLREVALHLGVEVSGTIETLMTPEEVEGWLRAAEAGMVATMRDGIAHNVTGPTEGVLRITREGPDPAGLTITGPQVFFDIWGVLARRLVEKAEQAGGSAQPVWVRMEEHAGLWHALGQSHPSLADKLALLTPIVRHILEPYPCLAGVILAPATLWAGALAPDHVQETIIGSDGGAAAVRSSVPPHRVRETIIVARPHATDVGLDAFIRWYEDEAGWLDWALARFGFPQLDELVQVGPTGG